MNEVHAEVGDTITFPDGTSITVENITPAVAEQYLAKNTHNRTLRPTKIGQYASDMQAGRWRWNGSTIVFGHSGQMDDGQHRCHAVIESGCTVRMLVVRGAELGAQDTIDTGIGRKFQDVLKLRGETQWVSLAAAVRSIHVWEMGVRRIGNAGGRTVSNPQLLDTLNRHPWIRDIVPLICRISTNSHLPTTVSSALYFAFSQVDPTDCEHFFQALAEPLSPNIPQPVFTLRKALSDNRDNVKGTRNVTYLAAITIKAWNAYRAGEEVHQLRWRAGGANPEAIPEPK